MWVFLSDSFLSIVQQRGRSGVLLVRGRAKGDIERVFAKAKVRTTLDADYRFRAEIPADEVANAISRQIGAISYDNFKSSVRETDRHDAYLRVWTTMNLFQGARMRRERLK